eukprot:5050501-Lingulodinium_polyedra.AAC.1
MSSTNATASSKWRKPNRPALLSRGLGTTQLPAAICSISSGARAARSMARSDRRRQGRAAR